MNELTPIELHDGIYLKREDKFEWGGACGGKARVAIGLIGQHIDEYQSFTTVGSRDSRQCDVVSQICEQMKLECHIFMPKGQDTDIIQRIKSRKYTTLHRTKVGYTNVMTSHAKLFCFDNHSFYIPFGMECEDAFEYIKPQVQNIPACVKRIVIPVGGGANMVGVLKGLMEYDMYDKEVVGVMVGKDSTRFIEKNVGASNGLFKVPNYQLVKAHVPYAVHVGAKIGDVELDDIYEAKCYPFLQVGDLLWIVGKNV